MLWNVYYSARLIASLGWGYFLLRLRSPRALGQIQCLIRSVDQVTDTGASASLPSIDVLQQLLADENGAAVCAHRRRGRTVWG